MSLQKQIEAAKQRQAEQEAKQLREAEQKAEHQKTIVLNRVKKFYEQSFSEELKELLKMSFGVEQVSKDRYEAYVSFPVDDGDTQYPVFLQWDEHGVLAFKRPHINNPGGRESYYSFKKSDDDSAEDFVLLSIDHWNQDVLAKQKRIAETD